MTYVAVAWRVSVPAGTYFLGDPCYAVPADAWAPLIENAGMFDAQPVGIVHGQQVLAFHAFGSSNGTDQAGREYTVDTGLIGLAPLALYGGPDAKYPPEFMEELGRIVTFKEPVYCTDGTRDVDGVLRFGSYVIKAAPYPDGD